MFKLSSRIVIEIIIGILLVIGLPIICYKLYEAGDETFTYTIIMSAILWLLYLDTIADHIKSKFKNPLRLLIQIATLVGCVAAICYAVETFRLIICSIILILCTSHLVLHIVKLSILRVQQKVQFQPVKPIIKP